MQDELRKMMSTLFIHEHCRAMTSVCSPDGTTNHTYRMAPTASTTRKLLSLMAKIILVKV